MPTRIVYQVNELQAESKKLLCQLQTSDPFIAFADYLLKAFNPLHHIQLNTSQRALLLFKTYPSLPDFSSKGLINIGWTVNTKINDNPIIVTSLNTIANHDIPDYIHSESAERYRTTSYLQRLSEVKYLIEGWCAGDIDVALILTGCALIDYAHPFWEDMAEIN